MELSQSPPRKRTARGEAPAFADFDPSDPEQVRQRKASANRTLTILKAGLNHAYREGKVTSDAAWRRVQPFREADAARLRYLSTDEIKRLLNASPPDLRRLLNAALFTGARYGELAGLKVRDFHPDSDTIFIAKSKAGNSRHVVLTEAGQGFFSEITIGRDPGEYLLTKENSGPWLKSHQARPLKAACAAAKIDPPASFHTIRHSYASHCVMAGIPLMVVAKNLGHSDTRMVEKHYGHLAPSYVADTIRKLAPDLGLSEDSNVERLEVR